MGALEDAEALVEQLKKEQELVKAVEAANEAHEANPSDQTYAAHNRAQEALFAHWSDNRVTGAVGVGGDAFVVPDDASSLTEGDS